MMARKSQPSPKGDAINDYEPLEVIGSGTFGLIRKVRRYNDGRIFARKELQFDRMTERDRRQICAEVNILRKVHHTNIVRYEDRGIDTDNGILYIVMEYCEGGDLGSMIQRCKKTKTQLTEDVVWSYLAQMVQGLHECHYHGGSTNGSAILHRDLKPENVFLDGQQSVTKIGDFGLSKEVAALDFARTFVGTPYYMSPELATGAPYDAKSDIWALGCIAYELCALAPPFDANDQQELTRKIKLGNVPRLPKPYSNQLGDMIRRMLELNPRHRPTTKELLQNMQIANALQALQLLSANSQLAEERRLLGLEWEALEENKRLLMERETAICHFETEWQRRQSELEDRERRAAEREEKIMLWEQSQKDNTAPPAKSQEPVQTPSRPALLRPGYRRVTSGGFPRSRSTHAVTVEAKEHSSSGNNHVVEVVHLRAHGGTSRSVRDRTRYGGVARPLLAGNASSRQREASSGGDEWVEDGDAAYASGSGSSCSGTRSRSSSAAGAPVADASDESAFDAAEPNEAGEMRNVAVAPFSDVIESPATSISSGEGDLIKNALRRSAAALPATRRRETAQSSDLNGSSHREQRDRDLMEKRPLPSARRNSRASQISPKKRSWDQQYSIPASTSAMDTNQDLTMRDASQMYEDKENRSNSVPTPENRSSPLPIAKHSRATAAAAPGSQANKSSRPALMTRATAPAVAEGVNQVEDADKGVALSGDMPVSASMSAQMVPPPAVYDLDDDDLPSPFLRKVTREVPRAMEKHLASLSLAKNANAIAPTFAAKVAAATAAAASTSNLPSKQARKGTAEEGSNNNSNNNNSGSSSDRLARVVGVSAARQNPARVGAGAPVGRVTATSPLNSKRSNVGSGSGSSSGANVLAPRRRTSALPGGIAVGPPREPRRSYAPTLRT